MDWATRRKLQYFSIIVAVVVIFFVIPFYAFIYKAPTCFDGLKDGNEAGIDCGGDCELLCSTQVAEPIARWDPRIFLVSSSTYSVVAYLENPNVNAEVVSAPYTFDLYDKDNVLVTEIKNTTFIPKGQSFAVFEGNINTGSRVPTRATFDFDSKLTWIKDANQVPDVSVTNSVLSDEATAPRVDATVVNNSVSTVSNIGLVAIILDGSGNAVAASRTYLESLGPSQSEPIVFTWPQPFVTKSEVCSSPVDVALVIDRSGSMASLSSNPPQPLTDVKNAATFFVNQLTPDDQAAVVSFATTASNPIESQLSSDISSLTSAISNISIYATGTQDTDIADGMLAAENELNSVRHKAGSSKVMITLTDGVANRPLQASDPNYPETLALSVANQSKIDGIDMFTIGLGKDVNTDFLKSVASSSDEFYLAPTSKDLSAIYKEIATSICKEQPAVIQITPVIYPTNLTP